MGSARDSAPTLETYQSLALRGSRAVVWACSVAAVGLGAIGFLPLFGGPGYEAALAAGLLLPATAAITTALVLVAPRPPAVTLAGREVLGFGVAVGSCLGLVALAVSFLHGLRVGFCDPWPGVWLMLLGPGVGAVMGGAWGAVAGTWAAAALRNPARPIVVGLALAGPLAGICLSLARFYQSPVVFAFDPFFGYFAGPLYDTVIDPVQRLASYRVGSLSTLLAVWVASGWFRLRSRGLAVAHDGRWGQTLAGGVALAVSITLTALGPRLAHNTSTESILEVLSRSQSHGRCDVHYDPGISKTYVDLLARDCEAHLEGLERYFDVKFPHRVSVLLFASAGQKSQLMGAANTLIAKPWRREIYLQQSSYPHPVLRHELAHVVAGSFGRGPFQIAGALNGWLPDPGRIEGFAEAAAPREDSDFSETEWAAAMLEVGLLPPLDSIFQLGFLGQNSSTAYTVAGEFVRWMYDHYGARAIKAWYGGAELQSITGGRDLHELESAFRADLAEVQVSARLQVAAKARFSVDSIFRRRCPHAVDQAFAEAQGLLGASDLEGAEAEFREVLEMDPDHIGARLGLGHCALRRGDAARALAAYQAVANDTRLALGNRLGAREAVANTEYLAGHRERARQLYGELLTKVADEDHLRNLDVKRLATTATGEERLALEALLLGTFKDPPNWDSAAPRLGSWREGEPTRGLPSYLIAKNLFNRSFLDKSASYLDEALDRELRLERVAREAHRLRVIVGCARLERGVVAQQLRQYLQVPGTTAHQKFSLMSIAERCGVQLPAEPLGASVMPQSAAKQ